MTAERFRYLDNDAPYCTESVCACVCVSERYRGWRKAQDQDEQVGVWGQAAGSNGDVVLSQFGHQELVG